MFKITGQNTLTWKKSKESKTQCTKTDRQTDRQTHRETQIVKERERERVRERARVRKLERNERELERERERERERELEKCQEENKSFTAALGKFHDVRIKGDKFFGFFL